MKKLISLLLLLSFIVSRGQDIPPKPNPPRLVNDLGHVLTPDQVAALESKLVAYDDSTSIQIAIVTVQTTGDYSIEDYALKILRTWGIGNKKTNNGLLILAAINDHKVFIATGYGMEGSIPDITAKAIVENEIVPNFREHDQNNYYRGFDLAADAIIKAAAGEYKAPEGYANRGSGKGISGAGLFGIFFIIFIIVIIIGRGGGRGGGGIFSGSGMLPWIIASMLSNRGVGGFGGGGGGGGGAGGSW